MTVFTELSCVQYSCVLEDILDSRGIPTDNVVGCFKSSWLIDQFLTFVKSMENWFCQLNTNYVFSAEHKIVLVYVPEKKRYMRVVEIVVAQRA